MTENELNELRRLTDEFYANEPSHASEACDYISEIVTKRAKKLGIKAKVVEGECNMSGSNAPNEWEWDYHVWIEVNGVIFDPKMWALRNREFYPIYKDYAKNS